MVEVPGTPASPYDEVPTSEVFRSRMSCRNCSPLAGRALSINLVQIMFNAETAAAESRID
jgi:hypothetical protein